MRIIAGRCKGISLPSARTGTRPTTDRTKEALFSRLDAWDVIDGARVLDLFAGTGALGAEALSRGASSVTWVDAAKPVAAGLQKLTQELRRHIVKQRPTVVSNVATQFPPAQFQPDARQEPSVVDGWKHDDSRSQDKESHSHNAEDRSRLLPSPLMWVTAMKAEQFVVTYHGDPFSLVFIDPPYAFSNELCAQLLNTMQERKMVADGAVVVIERSSRDAIMEFPDDWELNDSRKYGEAVLYYLTAYACSND